MNAHRWARIGLRLTLAGVIAGSGALAAAPAHAAGITQGTWQSPTAGQSVSGKVALSFATTATTVTFELPSGNQTGTVANGVATASWDTTTTPNATVTIGAQECQQLTGCDVVQEQVIVANPVLTPLTYSVSPGATVYPGSEVGITDNVGYGGEGIVTDSFGYSSGETSFSTFPYTVPDGHPANTPDTITTTCRQGCESGSITVIIGVRPPAPVPAPPPAPTIIVGYPNGIPSSTYFPVKDGYQDSFTVFITSDQEDSYAHLYIYQGKKVVSRGLAHLEFPSLGYPISAGKGLKPGRYTWMVTVTNYENESTSTKPHTLVADPRHLVSHPTTLTRVPAKLTHDDASGPCASAAGSASIVVKRDATCTSTAQGAGIGVANFFPSLVNAPAYSTIRLRVTTSGDPLVLIVDQGGTTTPLVETFTKAGTTTVSVPGTALSRQHHQLQFFLGLARGSAATITQISISYTYKTLAR